MRIGIDCFHDEILRSIIRMEGQKGNCDIQCVNNTLVYDTEISQQADLQVNLSQLLGLYATKEELSGLYPYKHIDERELDWIERQIKNEWHVFAVGPDDIRRILLAVCADEYNEVSPIFSQPVALRAWHDDKMRQRGCLTYNGQWKDFTESLKYENRFHQDIGMIQRGRVAPKINLQILKELLESESLCVSLEGQRLYRARIAKKIKFSPDEMGAPPAKLARAGRLNPEGISYLYLADSVETSLAEVRARAHDDVCIGRFGHSGRLRFVDFSKINVISPFAGTSFDLDWFAVNMKILNHIARDVEKTMRRQDSLLEYLPSQFIAEFIKSLGFDGIRFRSTLHNGGMNYVVFHEDVMTCDSVEMLHVNELDYRYKMENQSDIL